MSGPQPAKNHSARDGNGDDPHKLLGAGPGLKRQPPDASILLVKPILKAVKNQVFTNLVKTH